jgi:hypothetical protein
VEHTLAKKELKQTTLSILRFRNLLMEESNVQPVLSPVAKGVLRHLLQQREAGGRSDKVATSVFLLCCDDSMLSAQRTGPFQILDELVCLRGVKYTLVGRLKENKPRNGAGTFRRRMCKGRKLGALPDCKSLRCFDTVIRVKHLNTITM